MKTWQLLILCILACMLLPALSAAPATSIASVAATTDGPPPQDAAAYISEARLAVAERNWTGLLTITTKGTAWYPGNADLISFQGYAYRKMGYYERSVDVASRGILLDPKPVRYANRGYGYLALGNATAALADAESGIALNANYSTSYGVKALALRELGRNAEGLAAIDRALVLEPENAHYWHIRGLLLAAAGNCTGARDSFMRSLELDAGYDLPYPGFANARGSLAALESSCLPAPALPSPTRSPAGCGIAAIGIAGAALLVGTRK
jgi:tetratricopeptide (TPR) repeat protein